MWAGRNYNLIHLEEPGSGMRLLELLAGRREIQEDELEVLLILKSLNHFYANSFAKHTDWLIARFQFVAIGSWL